MLGVAGENPRPPALSDNPDFERCWQIEMFIVDIAYALCYFWSS